jgi:hypothetical protein
MSGLLAVVDATQEDFDKLSGKIEKSSGRAEEMAKIVGDNLSGKFAQMKSAIEETSLIVADRLMPVVEILTKVVINLANKFGDLNPTLQTTIIVIGAVVAAIGPLLVAIGGIIAILPTLVTAFAIITGPVGLTIAAVMGLVAAGIALYKNWDVVKIKMLKIVLSLENMFRKIFNSIYKFIFNKIDDILEKIAFFGKMLGKIFPDLEAKIGTLRSKFKDMDRNFTTANIVAELEIAKRQQELSAELENLRKEKIEETAVATENLTSATGNNTEAIGDNTEAIGDNTDELESNAVSVEDLRNKTIDAYEDIGTGVIDALRSMHDKKLEIEQKSINRTLSMVSRESRMKISEYNKVFVAKIRTLDAETAESLKAVQKQINSINNLTNAEEKELEEQEFLKEKSERLKRIEEEDSAEKKKELQEKLNDFILKRERQLILNRRQSVIEGLQDEMDKIREQAVSKKEELQKEYDAQKKNEEEIEARKKGHLEALLQQTKTHHEENTKEENLFAEARKLIIDGNQADIINLIKSYNIQWKDAGKSLGEKLLEGLSSVESRIRSKIASLTSLRGISSVTGMNIPAYATGTNYVPSDGLAYLHKGEAVIPASQNKAGMNGITVNVTGNTISNSRDADKLANTIVSKLRMAGVNP